ncbi:hypothetical protein MtrunA17_Chr4g0059661 [Medicago truncatula]|uniref:Uncharacterized protein n=1 Tax=Medicago truncatula TaxID=3880 RepID=A0A072UQE2_MEDTR|nr:uncharacterized protein LOC25493779 [Medicago truncatula]KEH31872.1 hypothetical protein MTR_4g107200 [Medicago truncatula]RHN63565.1 hypothetical protein MtrunA17_Chr4g0059661 [Medicago truncatula]
MEDSEKLTALKKAYADIILNTAKEAAARILVSERKSTHFQQELASTKDEALHMLLRLKQMMDSKVKEAELTSLSQQKKIDELEAQLQEAEEIVRDLRAELRETQAELENVTKHQTNPPVEQNMKDEVAANGNFMQENRLDPSDGTVHSAPVLQFEPVSVPVSRYPTVNGTDNGSKFCGSHDHANSCYIHNPDFASIVIRRKEPELYRNGCTQRIRALERSLFDGNVSVSGHLDNARDESLVGAHEEGKEATVTTNGKADIICEMEKPDELKTMKANADLVKDLVRKKNVRFKSRKTHRSRLHSGWVKETNKESYLSVAKDSFHVSDNNDPSKVNASMTHENETLKDQTSPLAEAPTGATATVEQPNKLKVVKAGADLIKNLVHRRRRRFRMRNTHRSRLHSGRVKERNKKSYLSCAKYSHHLLGNNDRSMVNSSMAHENEAQKDLISPFVKAPAGATTAVKQLGSHTDTEKGELFLKGCSSRNKIEDHKEPLDKSDLTRQEGLSTVSMEVSGCKDVKAADGSPDKMEPKVSDLDEKVSSRFENDKLIKYTFQRKRKKGSVSSGGVGCSPENSNSKKICGEKENGDVEPQTSCTMAESSRESRRLAQVARQLISLSEKKWWQ